MLGNKVKDYRASSHQRHLQIKHRTVESIKERLDTIRNKIKNAQGGYRQEVYNGMAEALSDAENALVDLLKEKHLELNGSVCSWEAEQHYRKIAKEALEKRRGNEEIPDRGDEPSSSL
jgi:hypothetical protein